MAIVSIPDRKITLSDPTAIIEFLEPHGIWYEKWEVSGRIGATASQNEILEAYCMEVERLKVKGGYVTADVISINPGTPGLDQMLDRFNKEHTHSEDEVRFVVDGEGIFHINPYVGDVFSIEMKGGDLINVPAGTRHWFNLCASKTIKTIRLFKDTSGWAPLYVEGGVHENYEPLCFSPGTIAAGKLFDPKIKP